MAIITQLAHYALLIFGFGFVVFFHELGHFLAAKYAGVKVEQFAIGFGPAMLSWRKGMGLSWGSSNRELKALQDKKDQTSAKVDISGYGDTEYRLNWVPLGGYVKMLGQDDLRPGAVADDPRAYNNKSIRARMVIVSAGVIMNVILAALLYMGIYMAGYPCPPARVGIIASNSPALHAMREQGDESVAAPLRAGDEILSYNGHPVHQDFLKVAMWVILGGHDHPVQMEVRRRGQTTVETLTVVPKLPESAKSMPALGLMHPPLELRGSDAKELPEFQKQLEKMKDLLPEEAYAVQPGDVITQVNGQDVKPDEFWKLQAALEGNSLETAGKPVTLTIKPADGKPVNRQVWPHFTEPFAHSITHDEPNNFLGLVPRARVPSVSPKSQAVGKLKPNDVITRLIVNSDAKDNPTAGEFLDITRKAAEKQTPITFVVLSQGDTATHTVADIIPSTNVGGGKRGVGIGIPQDDEQHTVIGKVQDGSPLHGKAKAGDTITTINGSPVNNWFQVRYLLCRCAAGKPVNIILRGDDGKDTNVQVTPTQADLDNINGITVSLSLDVVALLQTMPGVLVEHNPIKAMGLGVIETRDLILQFYITLQRMATGQISLSNTMGPVGIAIAGKGFVDKGTIWLVWFLAMISANLAVVNFLPIPVVDGGLFTLLILEKLQGRPLPEQTQKIIQTVGLVLILGVVLLVTYGDIIHHVLGY